MGDGKDNANKENADDFAGLADVLLEVVEQYIKEPTRHFPLEQYSMAYLPFSVQKLFTD